MQKHGGGSGDRFISKLLDFVTSVVPDYRRLPSNFWSSLSKLDFESAPFIIWAMVKTEAAAPPHAVSRGVTHYITSSHISALAEEGKADSIINANKLMKEYHEFADRRGIDGRDRIRIVDGADLLIIKLLFELECPHGMKTMEQVAVEAMLSMSDQPPEDASLVVDRRAEARSSSATSGLSGGDAASQHRL